MAPSPNEQTEAIAFLSNPATHGAPAGVDVIETHGNIIFLAGACAWKMKRAVHFPYMDFSSLALRRKACEAEIACNKRLAPALYLAALPITRDAAGQLHIAGEGEPVEWVVKMHRFQQQDLLSARAAAGVLSTELAVAVADTVYQSHVTAEILQDAQGATRIEAVLHPLLTSLQAMDDLDGRTVAKFASLAEAALQAVSPLLDQRAAAGLVRRCHGDLHAANIVIHDGKPLLYDAIEFDPQLATVDTLYDLAFLLMDLAQRGHAHAANIILNRYLWRSRNDLDILGVRALPLFMALRAAIRALVTAERARQEPSEKASRDIDTAQRLLLAACNHLPPRMPALIAIAGLSGTGKSTLAARLASVVAPPPCAIHLRSDLVRKALAGVEPTQRLPPDSYGPEASLSVYAELMRQARLALSAGAVTIVDAVCAKPHERDALRALAGDMNCAFCGLWLVAPPERLLARVTARHNDASDATAEVVRQQLSWANEPLGEGWRAVDAGGTVDETVQSARQAIEQFLPPPDKQATLA